MTDGLHKLSVDSLKRTHNKNSLQNHITSAYTEIDRLQGINNNRSAEVVQLTIKLQNQQWLIIQTISN